MVLLLFAVPEDLRTIWAANDTLRLHPLPVVLFPGGHVAFVQVGGGPSLLLIAHNMCPETLGAATFICVFACAFKPSGLQVILPGQLL